jgi:flagellar protein FliO/FliZ
MQSAGLMMFWFVVVLALIPASLWLLKRSGWQPKGAVPAAHSIKTLAQLGLGPGQRVMTIEVGQGAEATRLVIGVTAHSIQTLHVLHAGVAQAPFAQALAQQQVQHAAAARPEGDTA